MLCALEEEVFYLSYDGVDDGLELSSFHCVGKVALFEKAIYVEIVFWISGKDFSLFFDVLQQFYCRFFALVYRQLQIGIIFLEKLRVEFQHLFIQGLASNLPKVVLEYNFLIIVGEFYNIETQFGMPEIYKKYIFCLLFLLR